MTYKEMCETIVEADLLRLRGGGRPTWKQVFCYSPTGELHMIHEWFALAKAMLSIKSEVGADTYRQIMEGFGLAIKSNPTPAVDVGDE